MIVIKVYNSPSSLEIRCAQTKTYLLLITLLIVGSIHLSLFPRPDGSWWTGTVHLSVSESRSGRTEVACCRAYCFLRPEHAGSAGPPAQHRGAPETAAAHRLRPPPHCQS